MVEVAKMAPPSILIALTTTEDHARKSKKLAELIRQLEQNVDVLYDAAKKGDLEQVIEQAQTTAKTSMSLYVPLLPSCILSVYKGHIKSMSYGREQLIINRKTNLDKRWLSSEKRLMI